MGKKQHQKDKLYLTTKEWRDTYGGHKDDSSTRLQRAEFKRLPFTHCALSFLPFEDPVCSPEGVIFDLTHIAPYLKKHGINPVNGKKMSAKDLIVLSFAKDAEGNFRCPVTYRIFTPTSVIVAIQTTGNVYSMEAVDELNLKRNHMKDLLSDKPFQRKDIITLQDPTNLDKFNIEKFYHVQFDLKTKTEIEEEKREMQTPKYYLNKINNEAREALSQLEKQYVSKKNAAEKEQTSDAINAAHYSQGKVAAGLTSTVMAPVTVNKSAVLDEDTVKYSRVTKNGYVRIVTNYGPLNLELYCKHAPMACENFIVHCRNGYYNNSRFHRLIKGFIVQGGDPTGTGKGGESIWKKPFKDEFTGTYKHDTRGVLSMANAGTNSNNSQFFLTLSACPHLNGKHTVFGRLVGGGNTLVHIENVESDSETSRPLDPIVFMSAEIFVDPFEEAAEKVKKDRDAETAKHSQTKTVNSEEIIKRPKAFSSGIGKYIKPDIKNNLKRINLEKSDRSEDKRNQKDKNSIIDAQDLRSELMMEGMLSEEEARKRREQLNRRPSYRMILKDLETIAERPLKKEVEENASAEQTRMTSLLDCNNSPAYCPTGESGHGGRGGGYNPTASGVNNELLRGLNPMVGTSTSQPPIGLISTLTLLPPTPQTTRLLSSTEIPSQPQPQQQQGGGGGPLAAGGPTNNNNCQQNLNSWQNNLLTAATFAAATSSNSQLHQVQSAVHRAQQQQQQPSHVLTSPLISNNNVQQQFGGGGGQGGGPHAMSRAVSASLTSLSDNDDTNRKRQVRLLKNREAAKECRRKKKEYVKCLENRVAVLENQNKALIEELKTLKELYCRKEQNKDVNMGGNGM